VRELWAGASQVTQSPQPPGARARILRGDATARGASHAPRELRELRALTAVRPCARDDFYLNLVDWSSHNVLAVGLGKCVYLWSACTSKVTKLCDLGPSDSVCSVAWTQRGTYLAVGTNLGRGGSELSLSSHCAGSDASF
jgi:WD40 repeat protein